ncbi:Fe-S cluster assembly protein SufD [Clostridium sp. BJN0013]|uniref:Fe-S cluster assembly protein SufD n=1 Tax=Clostridium sp. BJN0013 TaxID=3236840 RepID=UPI0034C65751
MLNEENFNENKDMKVIFESKRDFKVNSTYVPTWKCLGLNNFPIKDCRLSKINPYDKDYINFKVEDFKEAEVVPINKERKSEYFYNYPNFKEASFVCGDFVKLGEEGFNSGVFVKVPPNKIVNSNIRLNFNLDKDNTMVIDHNIIVAEANSKITFIVDYHTDNEEINAFHNGITKIIAKDGSEVNVVKIQRMNDKSFHFDWNMALVERSAKINWITIEIGSSISVTNYNSDLIGEHSEVNIYSAYMVDGDRKQDIYYTNNHFGKKSISNMWVEGVLKDRAKKVFKGNIDFKKGCYESKGSQMEEVLLLDPEVKTDSVPMLLCREENVDGAHAASIGKIDEDELFYLMSRGFNYSEAQKLVIEARFNPIFDRIPAEDLRELLSEELNRRII